MLSKEDLLKNVVSAILVAVLGASLCFADSPSIVRETALARIPKARAVAADPEVVKAVLAKNASHESMEQILRHDKAWTDDIHYPLRKTLSTNACAQHLRALVKDDPTIVEVILMDAQGANVCVSPETTDYWQGDEAKWQKTYGANKEVFVDEPSLDSSTGVYAIQLSVIVSDGVGKIGALTLTLKIRREDVTPIKPN
jgi:hypothetical protein